MWQGNLFLQRPKISSFHWNSSRTKDYPTPKSSNFLIITFSRTTFFYKITFQLKLFLHISLDDKSQNCSTIQFHSTVNCPHVDPRESNLLKIMVKVLSTCGLFKFVGLSSRLITADPSIIFSFHHYPRLVGCQSNPRIGSFFKLTSQKEFQFHFSAFSVFNQGLVERQCTANPFISTNCFPLSPSDLFHLLLIYLHYLYALSSIGLFFITIFIQ